MRHLRNLHRIPLTTVENSVRHPKSLIADSITGIPEFGCYGLVGHIFQHARNLTVFDLPKGVTTKLEVTPHLIDTKTSHSFDINSIFGVVYQFIE